MLRISKLCDYAIVLLTHFAQDSEPPVWAARDVAAAARIPLPTVSKLLKSLSRAGLLVSQRGVRGGYRLARSPDEISIADVIAAIDGPLALTECAEGLEGLCGIEKLCPARRSSGLINQTVREALGGLKLSEMVGRPRGRPAGVNP
jgi:FeS assembly SUF system regulator